jgi:GrpB-like predicted nucleotidyltransferase (UPF0157 family)
MTGIEKYSSDWPKKYKLESEKIRAILGDVVIDIQHIGSTSIPGMLAKPLVDIGVLVNAIDDIDFFVQKLKNLEYSYKPDMSSAERIFFRKGDPVVYHLSIACPKHTFWKRQIVFRDYLRKHHEFVEEYNALKLGNIKITPKEVFSDLSRSKTYNQGKEDLVNRVLKLAEKENINKVSNPSQRAVN